MNATQMSNTSASPTQLKLSVPPSMYAKLKDRAGHAGVPVTSYVRHLLIAGLENSPIHQHAETDMDSYLSSLPVYEATPRVDASHAQVMKELKEESSVMLLHDSDDVNTYINKLEKSIKTTKSSRKKKI